MIFISKGRKIIENKWHLNKNVLIMKISMAGGQIGMMRTVNLMT